MPQTVTEQILDMLAPMLYGDAQPLTDYLTGLAQPFELVNDWASDTDDDKPGWSLLVDVDRCPDVALPWLAQLVGMRLPVGISANDQRVQIRSLQNFRRGTLHALAMAPQPYLTGNKTVIVRERYDGSGNDAPWDIEVITFTSETPNPTITEAVLRAQKAAGLRLTYNVITGQDFQSVKDNYATLQDVKNAYVTLGGVRANLPGT